MAATKSTSAVVFFCGKSKEHILRDGGSQSWRLVPRHAAKQEFVVCCRSAVSWVEGTEERGSAFLIGRISGVVPATDNNQKGRYLVQMSEYAEIDVPKVWRGWRNPVKYSTLEELGINLEGLEFKPMPAPITVAKSAKVLTEAQEAVSQATAALASLTIAQAKKALAATYEVTEDAIEITIRG